MNTLKKPSVRVVGVTVDCTEESPAPEEICRFLAAVLKAILISLS